MAEAAQPVQAHWFIEDVDSYAGAWKPLWKCDSDRLEQVYASGESGRQVPIYCTRALVDMDSRTSVTTYYESKPVRVRRSTWFFKDRKGNFVPYEEDLAQALEDWALQLVHDRKQLQKGADASATSTTVAGATSSEAPSVNFQVQKTFEEHKLTFLAQRVDMPTKGLNTIFQSSSQPVIEDVLIYEYTNWTAGIQLPSMGSSKTLSLPSVGTSTQVRRGYQHTPVPGEELAELEPGHLLLVVHGIGESFFSRADSPLPSFRVSVRELRSNILESQMKLRDAARAAGNEELANLPIRRIEALPIEWFDAVHGPEDELTKKLALVTLPSLTMVRTFGNEAVADVMLYCNPVYQQKILTRVVDRLNYVYLRYMELNPGFSGRVSIVGHSLGSIITFDILSHQASNVHSRAETELREATSPTQASTGLVQLNAHIEPLAFHPEVYFSWGSPTALFLSIRGTDLTNFRLPTCRRMYNMFKPHDVIAYRTEPLQDERFAAEAPAAVPHSVDAYKPLLDRPDSSSWTSIMKKVAGISEARRNLLASETPGKFPTLQLNEGARLDWALSVGAFEHEYVSAVSAHTGYFTDSDIALFLATHLQVHDDVKAIALVELEPSDARAPGK